MLQQAFDQYAIAYDAHFTDSLIGRAQRERVYHFLRRWLPQPGSRILEVNCGTGEDAAYLSRKGFRVTASDLSAGMVRVASQKAANRAVHFICSPVQDLHRHVDANSFDLLFSNFGGFNCLSPQELQEFSGQAHGLLAEDACLVAVVMGRHCWWERFFFSWRKEPLKARRRLSAAGVDTQIEGRRFDTWYYSPAELSGLFGAHFEMCERKPVGLFVPPSYLESWIASRKGLFGVLCRLEQLFGNLDALSDRADHYFIVLKKKRL